MTEQELLSLPDAAYLDAAQQAFFCALLLSQRTEFQERISGEFQVMREFEPSSDPSDLGRLKSRGSGNYAFWSERKST